MRLIVVVGYSKKKRIAVTLELLRAVAFEVRN